MDKPRTFKASQQSANLLLSVKPEVMKIQKQLQEDAEVKISPGTLLFFGFLLFVGIFVVSILLFNNRSFRLTEETMEGNGRGINMPTVVPPTNTPEGQEYIRIQEEMARAASEDHPLSSSSSSSVEQGQGQGQDASSTGSSSTGTGTGSPSASTPMPQTKVAFYDQHGRQVDPSTIDFSKFQVKEAF